MSGAQVAPPQPCRRDERGAGTVLALAMVGVVLFVTVAVSGVVAVVGRHRIAQSAADLAALAGAAALQEGRDACASAAALARRNQARLTGCRVSGWEVEVRVVSVGRVWGMEQELAARGRAGPVGPQS
jgi:secretion/DNA translocation related TadE-like protein